MTEQEQAKFWIKELGLSLPKGQLKNLMKLKKYISESNSNNNELKKENK